jgi:integrase
MECYARLGVIGRTLTLFSLSNQFDLFLVEQSRGVEKGTLEGYKSKFDCLFEYISASYDCREFGKIHVQEIKTALLNRPANAKKGTSGNLMKAKTINSYLSNYRTFFEWLVESVDGVERNPFSNVSIKKSDAEYVFRRPFSPAEIKKLMNYQPSHASEAKWFRDDASWYIPVALYTGMRLNEIADIKLEEIKIIDDVWCFDLSNQDVKNKASQRTVPIAQYLLDIGLMDYVDKLKRSGQTFLFYQIRKGRDEPGPDGWGEPISRWFNRTVLKKIGIDADAEKLNKKSVVFHCIRHTFISSCIKKGAQKHFVKRIVGHSDDDEITIGVYSDIQNTPMYLLKEVLDDNLMWHLAA